MMDKKKLPQGVTFGVAYEGTSSVEAIIALIRTLDAYAIDRLLILPYRVNDDPDALVKRLDTLLLEGFSGLVVISLLGITCTDDALFCCLRLRDALACPELTVVVCASCEDEAELEKSLALAGFSDLPDPTCEAS